VELRRRLIYVPDVEALRRRADATVVVEDEQLGERGERTP
jgi:hypothetical protein